jgi:hypothetical protein
MSNTPWTRFVEDLPACCNDQPLRLPRPATASIEFNGVFGPESGAWALGLDEWAATIRVGWWLDEIDPLVDAVSAHTGRDLSDLDALKGVLADHGVHLRNESDLWAAHVGEQTFLVARVEDPSHATSGRHTISDGHDLFYALDSLSHDLMEIATPLSGGDLLFSEEVEDALPDGIITESILILRAVDVTPVLRGHHLGAWAAAVCVTTLATNSTLIATYAAPLSQRDAVPGYDPDVDPELTPEQSALWHAEQARLAAHWQTTLGLTPLASEPNVLVAHTSLINEALETSLAAWTSHDL